NQNERFVRPSLFAAGVPKSAVKLEQLLSVLPNGNRRAELAELLEIFPEQGLETRAKFVRIELHDECCRGGCLGRKEKSIWSAVERTGHTASKPVPDRFG